MIIRRLLVLTQLLALALMMSTSVGIVWAAAYEPRRGSAEREAILDALRPAVEGKLRSPVEFVVSRMRVHDGWAFVEVEPQRPRGRPIDSAALGFDTEMMNGLTTWALLKHQSGGWTLVTWVLGPTDVAWEGWWDTYGAPRDIFP